MRAYGVLAVVGLLGVSGCQAAEVKDTSPLPTASVAGKVICGFASQDSFVKALGTSDFSLSGSSQDLGTGGTNPDGSKLNEADCTANTKDAPLDALKLTVVRIGVDRHWDSAVMTRLAEGGLSFVFPADEGTGFATAGENPDDDAAEAHLILGDWHYFVKIHPRVEGRDAVQDAVALAARPSYS